MKKFYVASFDLEATDLCIYSAAICEFGTTCHLFTFTEEEEEEEEEGKDGKKKLSLEVEDLTPFSMYCQPRVPMSESASRVTGLTNEFLNTHKKTSIETVLGHVITHLDTVFKDSSYPSHSGRIQ